MSREARIQIESDLHDTLADYRRARVLALRSHGKRKQALIRLARILEETVNAYYKELYG